MKKFVLTISICFIPIINIFSLQELSGHTSKIDTVKLYQNQAQVTRTARLTLRKGNNKFLLSQLPTALIDWSVKGKLPKNVDAKILSIQVEKKALLEKRNNKIALLEKQIKKLREKDVELIDRLSNIKSEERFVNSLINFEQVSTNTDKINQSPSARVWSKTVKYIGNKKQSLLKKKRKIERSRERLGQQLQKKEYDLYKISGHSYYQNYQKLNHDRFNKRGLLQLQNYQNSNYYYTQRKNLLTSHHGETSTEKQVNIEIFSNESKKINLTFQYQIRKSSWRMQYDFRANLKKKLVSVNVFGNIYQNTSEDWQDINLVLSTGNPKSQINLPHFPAWKIFSYKYSGKHQRASGQKLNDDEFDNEDTTKNLSPFKPSQEKNKTSLYSKIDFTGISFDIDLPIKQSISSSNKNQKRFIREYKITNKKALEFYYELTPALSRHAYIKAKVINNTSLPWLKGQAQLFLDNEFIGKTQIPYTPVGKKQLLLLGSDKRINATKVLEKKSNEKSGLFNGNKEVTYEYKLQVENNSNKKIKIVLIDSLPYPTSNKVDIKIKSLSLPFSLDPQIEDRHQKDNLSKLSYNRGIRKWIFMLNSNDKKTIRYNVSVTIDKNLITSGVK